MKRIIYLALVFAVAFSCSEDGEKKAKCSFTFKEKSYSTNTTTCQAGVDYLLRASSDDWELILNTSDNTIIFYDNVHLAIYGQNPNTIVTRADNTLTFEGVLENDDDPNDTGEISGKCTCGN